MGVGMRQMRCTQFSVGGGKYTRMGAPPYFGTGDAPGYLRTGRILCLKAFQRDSIERKCCKIEFLPHVERKLRRTSPISSSGDS